jgi:hypothetical protein
MLVSLVTYSLASGYLFLSHTTLPLAFPHILSLLLLTCINHIPTSMLCICSSLFLECFWNVLLDIHRASFSFLTFCNSLLKYHANRKGFYKELALKNIKLTQSATHFIAKSTLDMLYVHFHPLYSFLSAPRIKFIESRDMFAPC